MIGTDDDYLLEHSLDLRVNSYTHRATEPGYKVGGGESCAGGVPVAVRPYCLAVKNVPSSLTRTGLYNIFSQFGDLLECQLGGDRGKVSYSNGVQAATAMAQLDRKEPYKMVVDWQVDREIREKKQIMDEEEKIFADQINEEFDQFVASEVRWNPEDIVNKNVSNLDKDNADHSIVKNDSDDPAQVTQSTSFVYQFNQPLSVSPPAKGLCCSCSLPGILLCSVCKAWYCSAACQRDHWNVHKRYCGGKPPPLEMISDKVEENSKDVIVMKGAGTNHKVVINSNEKQTKDDDMNVVRSMSNSEEVVVSYVRSPTDLYIQSVSTLSLLSCMMVELQSPTYHSIRPTNIQQDNTIYMTKCEGVWFRVRVTSISPTHTKARVILIDYGNTDIVELDSLRTLPVHKAVQPLAKRVQLVKSSMEQEWDKEELTRLREIVGEGCGTKFKLVKTEEDGTVSLVGRNGRNVLDIWKEGNSVALNHYSETDMKCIKSTELEDSIVKLKITAGANKEDLTGIQAASNHSELKSENIPQLNAAGLTGNPFLDQISSKILEDTPAHSNAVGSNSSIKSGQEQTSGGNHACQINVSKDKFDNSSDRSTNKHSNKLVQGSNQCSSINKKGSNQDLRKVKPSTNQNSRNFVKSSSNNSYPFQSVNKVQDKKSLAQDLNLRSVLDDLTVGCRVELLKITADPWSNFRSICAREVPENKDADWVLGGLQLEGSSAVELNYEVGVGDIVVAWNKDDQMFYRVVVIKKEHVEGVIKYHTVSMDFGREMVYASRDLRKPWDSVQKHCALGIIVKCERNLSKDVEAELNRIGREGISMEVTSCSKEEAVLAVKMKGKVFRWKATPAVQERDKFPTNLSVPPPPLPPAPAPVPLQPGLQRVLLLRAESPALIYICTFPQYNNLTNTMVPKIQTQAITSHPVSVAVQDSLVLVNYSDMWHRAKLDLVSHNSMVANLIDLGHSIPVTSNQLKLAEPIVRSWPAVAVPCVMAEWAGMARDRTMLDSMRNTWSNTMKSLVSNFQELELRVLSVDKEGLHVVHIPAWEGIVMRGQGSQS